MVSSHALLLIVPLRLNPTDTSPTVNFTAFPYNKVPSRRFCNCFCTYRSMAWNALTATLLLWQTSAHSKSPSDATSTGPVAQARCLVSCGLLFDSTALLSLHGPCHVAQGSSLLVCSLCGPGDDPFPGHFAELPPPLPSASSIALGSQGCSE